MARVLAASALAASVAAQGARNTPVTSLQLGMAASADNCELRLALQPHTASAHFGAAAAVAPVAPRGSSSCRGPRGTFGAAAAVAPAAPSGLQQLPWPPRLLRGCSCRDAGALAAGFIPS